jgi:hypothetical protein
MKRLVYLTVASPITLKGVFIKPLKFVIQIFTAAPEEHIAHCIDGVVCNVSGEGLRYIPFKDWMEHYKVNGARIHALELIDDATDEQIEAIKAQDRKDEGKKYDALAAAFSALDNVYDIKSEGIYCSHQCDNGVVAAGILPSSKDQSSPTELKSRMLKSGKFTRRRIN